jgi:hypothetical protein
MVWHIVVAPLVVVAPFQHLAHDPPKNCYRLVYHKKGLLEMEFINPWNVEGAFVRPKGMTKNS